MTGSLQTKNEKFYIVLNDTVNGKRKQRWIATGLSVKGNKRKAEQMLREKLASLMQQKKQQSIIGAEGGEGGEAPKGKKEKKKGKK